MHVTASMSTTSSPDSATFARAEDWYWILAMSGLPPVAIGVAIHAVGRGEILRHGVGERGRRHMGVAIEGIEPPLAFVVVPDRVRKINVPVGVLGHVANNE